jgi:drug/metabolite transporter (DMT)-like permease
MDVEKAEAALMAGAVDRKTADRLPVPNLSALVAPVFVLIWSTGFIGARYGMPYAEPATFLAMRFGGVLIIMVPAVLLMHVPAPALRLVAHIAVAGLLMQGGYLLGVFEAIRHGMGAGLAALIVGLQPVLTAVLGSLVSERVTGRQWIGLGLGLAGVTLVGWERLSFSGLSLASVAAALAALVAITAGTLYQKRYAPVFDLRMGSVIQFSAALLLVVPVALLFETRQVEWRPELVGALLWSVLALSLGATSLLFLLIRRGAATKVASLMYLTPAVTAIMAWILFDEALTAIMLAGMALTAVGVASMMRTPARRVLPSHASDA